MCSFEISISSILTLENNKIMYQFDIIDPISFNHLKSYQTFDHNPVLFYLVHLNQFIKISIQGQTKKHLTKNSLLHYSTYYTFRMSPNKSFFVIHHNNNNSTPDNPPPFSLGQTFFVRTNLVYDCCDRI